MCGCSHTPPTGDLAHNPGMCPDWESNQQSLCLQASAQCTEPNQPGLTILKKNNIKGGVQIWSWVKKMECSSKEYCFDLFLIFLFKCK